MSYLDSNEYSEKASIQMEATVWSSSQLYSWILWESHNDYSYCASKNMFTKVSTLYIYTKIIQGDLQLINYFLNYQTLFPPN